MATWYPLLILVIGLAIVVGGIVVCRVNAFLAMLTAAMTVSLLAPGEAAEKISRVAEAFGATAAGIGIVIGLAAVIGRAMQASGAADRIVTAALAACGEKRAATALSASSFVLAIPVFFDTVFYLLVPLARSMTRRTGGHYLRYLIAVATCVGAHALVPPTPGPLLVAAALGVEVGQMLLVGFAVAVPATAAGLAFAVWADRNLTVEFTDAPSEEQASSEAEESLPGLAESLAPVLLPTGLIAANTITKMLGHADSGFGQFTAVAGNPNLALLLAAAVALSTYWRMRRPTTKQFSHAIDESLMSGGVIILITAAGGAFGAMLKQAQLADAVQSLAGESAASGYGLLFFAFGVASLLKFALGSSTAAMIVTSAMLAAVIDGATLGFSPVYLAAAIGSGSLVGSWMNDSGFWIFAKMGGLSEIDTLRIWTPLLAIEGATAMAVTLLMARLFPMV